jgi:outer membrane protein
MGRRNPLFAILVTGALAALLALFVDFGGPLGLKVGLAQAPERRPLKIGIVDVSKVLDQYEKKARFDAELKEFQASQREKMEEKELEIQKTRDKMELLLPGSSERKKEEEKLSQLEIEREWLRKSAYKDINEKYAQLLVELYEDIVKECAAYAKAEKFDLILKKEELNFDNLGPEEVKFIIKSQKIIYNVGELDVTEAIIKRLKSK